MIYWENESPSARVSNAPSKARALVGASGLEPETSRPPALRATICATPRCYRHSKRLYYTSSPNKSYSLASLM